MNYIKVQDCVVKHVGQSRALQDQGSVSRSAINLLLTLLSVPLLLFICCFTN